MRIVFVNGNAILIKILCERDHVKFGYDTLIITNILSAD